MITRNKNKKGFTYAPLFRNSPKSGAGFTLIETIVALALGLLVTVMVLSVFSSGLSRIKDVKNTESLHSNAVFLFNTLTYWIKQSKDLNVTPPSELEIVLPSSSKIITKTADNKITLNGLQLNTDDIEVTTLTFTPLAKSVQINFKLQTKNGDKTFSATTTIAQRN